MPSESSTPTTDQANNTLQPLRANARSRGAATIQRHKDERRAESLAQIRAQIANGTLVVRQMATAQRKTSTRSRAPDTR